MINMRFDYETLPSTSVSVAVESALDIEKAIRSLNANIGVQVITANINGSKAYPVALAIESAARIMRCPLIARGQVMGARKMAKAIWTFIEARRAV